MVETVGSIVALSDATAQLVERAGGSFVSIHGGGRGHSNGVHWRCGIIVTAARAVVRVVSRCGLSLRTRRAYCRELNCRHCFLSKQ